MDRKSLTVHEGDLPPAPEAGTGHYFDQAVFDLHYRKLALKAQRMALEADMAEAGFEVDAEGRVTLKSVR